MRFIPFLMSLCNLAYREPNGNHPLFWRKAENFQAYHLVRDMGYAFFVEFRKIQYLIFRGTDTEAGGVFRKWYRNVKVGPLNDNGYHDGFWQGWYHEYAPWVYTMIDNGIIKPDKPLEIGGHSAGHAVAGIAYSEIWENRKLQNTNFTGFSGPQFVNRWRRDRMKRIPGAITQIRIKGDFVTKCCVVAKHPGEFIDLPIINPLDWVPILGLKARHIQRNVLHACCKRWGRV